MHILLVDDEEELVSTLADRLEFRGYHADAVLSGADAIKKIGQKSYNVAVIDVKMPEINGIEVMKMMLKLQPDIKIILMTGHGSTEEGERGMAEGAFDYMVKPINIDLLTDKIKTAVGIRE
ncbi:MAG TPA: response regulator [candidate division Zixibacteria bacterium]|nr:response regulator [candidate division Zixibacteria bacterium]HEQ98255.1 response regulator [candidate division Zixibacteria bacterium]